jgi:hypothetical protein
VEAYTDGKGKGCSNNDDDVTPMPIMLYLSSRRLTLLLPASDKALLDIEEHCRR